MKPSPILMMIAIAIAAALGAGAAQAQSEGAAARLDLRLPDLAQDAVPTVPVARAVGVADKAVPDLADPLDPLAPTKLVVKTMDSEVFAKTAVDHKFDSRSDITGSLGFLCGLQPGHNDTGGVAAYGVDPHGRFVGAKLSFAF